MGNKQQGGKGKQGLDDQRKPRNIYSMYGPKQSQQSSVITATSESIVEESEQSMATLEPTQIVKLKDQKQALRLSRANRCGRSDGFYCHGNNFESLETSLKFVSKCYEIVANLEINASIFSADELKEGMTSELSRFSLMPLLPQLNNNQVEESQNSRQNQDQESIEFSGLGNSQDDDDGYDEDCYGDAGFIRPTALFGRHDSRANQTTIPFFKRDSSFNDNNTGIQLVGEASYEDVQPVRPTANFGDLPAVQGIRGQRYAHMLQNHTAIQQQWQQDKSLIREEDDENESNFMTRSEAEESSIAMNNASCVDRSEKHNSVNEADENDDDDSYIEVEPVYIKIDLSQKKKSAKSVVRQNPHHTIETASSILKKSTSRSPTPNKPTSANTTPKHSKNQSSSSNTINQAAKSPTMTQTITADSLKNRNHSKSPSAGNITSSQSKSPVSKHKTSSSLVVVNGSSMVKNTKSKQVEDESTIDSQIEKLTGDIAVLDQIKADITKVQKKIINDMSPSYRPANS